MPPFNENFTQRTDIAKQLVEAEYFESVSDAFIKLLNTDSYQHFTKSAPTIQEGISMIKACGGIPVWAHPYCVSRGGKMDIAGPQSHELAKKMLQYGIEGVEVFYQLFHKDAIIALQNFARENNLLMTCGTDYHQSPPSALVFEKEGIKPDITILSACGVLANVSLAYILKGKIDSGKTQIHASEFSYENDITEIVIPEGITTIEMRAFAECANLKKVVLPSTIKMIGHAAFKNCTSLAAINIPTGTIIESEVFEGCKNLKLTDDTDNA